MKVLLSFMPYYLFASVSFLAHHAGPFEHFSHIAPLLEEKGEKTTLYATDVAWNKAQKEGTHCKPFFAEDFQEKDLVVIDTATSKEEISQIRKNSPSAKIYLYYDNPEPYVPGGYSINFAKKLPLVDGVIFANKTLKGQTIYSSLDSPASFGKLDRFYLGYYPTEKAQLIRKKREKMQKALRKAFFEKNQIVDKGEKLFVYFGGNNEEYFSKAFPHFCFLLSEGKNSLKNAIFLIHQHPGAKKENRDISHLKKQENLPKIYFSDYDLLEAAALADSVLYFQTSMAPQMILANIPTYQIGHRTYPDVLVKNSLAPSIKSLEDLPLLLEEPPQKEVSFENLLKAIGSDQNWPSTFLEKFFPK